MFWNIVIIAILINLLYLGVTEYNNRAYKMHLKDINDLYHMYMCLEDFMDKSIKLAYEKELKNKKYSFDELNEKLKGSYKYVSENQYKKN